MFSRKFASSTFYLIKNLWKFLSKRRRFQVKILLFAMVISAFAEIFTIASIFPFLSLLSNPEKLSDFKYLNYLSQNFQISSNGQLLIVVSMIFVFIVIITATIRLINIWLIQRIAAAIGTDLSCEAYKRTLYQPYITHTLRNTSEIIANTTTNVNITVDSINRALQIISGSIISLFILIFLIIIDVKVAFSSILVFSLSYGFISLTATRKLLNNGIKVAKATNEQVKVIQEGLGAIRDVIINNGQNIYIKNYLNTDKPLRRLQCNSQFLALFPRYTLEAITLILIIFIAFGVSAQEKNSALVISTLGTLALGFQRLLPSFQQIYASWAGIKSNSKAISNVINMISQPLPLEALINKKYKPIKLQKEILLENISFKYPGSSDLVLLDINLSIKSGEKVGLTGETGSGKSTLMDLLLGLLKASSGKFLIDDINIYDAKNKSILNSWCASVAHVPQTIYLSDSTVYENIAFGIERKYIDKDLAISCAKKANVSNFVETFPEGYKTIIGERGIRLSGGQRQRIGIARALYNQKKILFLDEATSALDNRTESTIMRTINNLDRNLTIIMIAHRLTTLKEFDKVIEIKQGKVVH